MGDTFMNNSGCGNIYVYSIPDETSHGNKCCCEPLDENTVSALNDLSLKGKKTLTEDDLIKKVEKMGGTLSSDQADELFRLFAGKDGKLSKKELKEMKSAIETAMENSKDGTITLEDIKAIVESHGSHRESHHHHGGKGHHEKPLDFDTASAINGLRLEGDKTLMKEELIKKVEEMGGTLSSDQADELFELFAGKDDELNKEELEAMKSAIETAMGNSEGSTITIDELEAAVETSDDCC